jgi:hypothetical protein
MGKSKVGKKQHGRSHSEQIDVKDLRENGQCASAEQSSSSSHRRTKSSVVPFLKSFVHGKHTTTYAHGEGSVESGEFNVKSKTILRSASKDSAESKGSTPASVFRKVKKRVSKAEDKVGDWLTPATLNSFDRVDQSVTGNISGNQVIEHFDFSKAVEALNGKPSALLIESISNPAQVLTQYIFEMRKNPLEKSVQIKGCKGVGNTAALSGLPPDISHEVIGVILCSMRTFPNKADVQVSACQALRRSSAKVERGVDSSNPQLPAEAPASSASTISLNHTVCKEIVDSGAVHSVLKAMLLHKDCRDLQREGIRVLRHAMSSNNIKAKEIISDLKGIEIIISAMWSFSDSSVVQEDGSILIWSLAFDDLLSQSLILQNNGVGAILSAMFSFSDSEAVQRFSTGGLHALSSDEDTCLYILDNGGVQVIMQTIEKFGHVEDIVEKALATIANVAVSNEDSVIFTETDAPTMISAVKLHIHVESVRKIGCFLLETIKREKGLLDEDDPELHFILSQASSNDMPLKTLD